MNTKAQTVRDAGKAPHIAITASQMRKQRAQRRKERDERSRGYDIRKLEERERAASVASDSPNTRQGQAQHSPLPWKLEIKNGSATIIDGNGDISTPLTDIELGWTDTSTGNYSSPDIDAEILQRIVRAVNNVEQLAEALRDAIKEIHDCAEDCMTEAKARKWLEDNEPYWSAKSALASYEKDQQL